MAIHPVRPPGIYPIVCRPLVPLLSLAVAAALGLRVEQARASGDFYEAPAETLADFLRKDELPAKSIRQILGETAPKEEDPGRPAELPEELEWLPKMSGPEALAKLDEMIAVARFNQATPLLNVFNDLHDLYAGSAAAPEVDRYLQWRIDHASDFGLDFSNALQRATPAEPKAVNQELLAEIDDQLTKASPALQPHWLYLRGAALYRGHQIGESQAWFARVTKEFPQSPRAEAALFMQIRCQIWRSRDPQYTEGDRKLVPAERPKAKELLDEYFASYPQGRLFGDALGWAAAFAFDGSDYATALRDYVQLLDLPGHPELAEAAAEMVERTLAQIARDPKDQALAEVAKSPRAAQAIVYLVINTSDDGHDHQPADFIAAIRGWRKTILSRLGAAVSAEAGRYTDTTWKPRELAMLAYATSGAGQHLQAAKLLDDAAEIENSDDLLMARGVILHRAKRPGEAAAALQTLLERFPDSPLKDGARLRLALAQTDDHHAGEAVLSLQQLLTGPVGSKKPMLTIEAMDETGEPDRAGYYSPFREENLRGLRGVDLFQVEALIDALLNFAPIAELAAPTQEPNLDPVLRLELTNAIAQRLLAREQFDEAKKFLTTAQYALVAGPLEALTQAARAAKDPAVRAAACLKLGDAWAAARGQLLTYPLDTNQYRWGVFADYAPEANQRRVESAPFVGAEGDYRLDLENRDELRHAFHWWLEAADAQPGTPQTAQALWRALKAMPQIADVSPYTFARAVSRNWTATARQLYDRLRAECPDSVEARRYVVAWDFTAPVGKNSGDEFAPLWRRPAAPADGHRAPPLRLPAGDSHDRPPQALRETIAEFEAFADRAGLVELKIKVSDLERSAREIFTGPYDTRWLNFLDDLALFLSEPDPGAPVRKRYLDLRLRFLKECAVSGGYSEDEHPDEKLQKEIEAARADSKNKAIVEYLDFLKLAVTANHFVSVPTGMPAIPDQDSMRVDRAKDAPDTYRSHDYPKLARETQAFLEKYPKSKKREAALLLHARAVYQSSREVELRGLSVWPEAPRWEGGAKSIITQREPFNFQRVQSALDAYDQAFPGGLYAANIRGYRAELALRLHRWKPALELFIAQYDDPKTADLHADAAQGLANLFSLLTDERYRADILAVIQANGRGKELLEQYLSDRPDRGDNPLLYMRAWLREELK